MKGWFKLFVGAFLGLLAGFLLPQDNQSIYDALSWLEQLALQIGRYSLVPVLAFSLMIAVYEVRQEHRMWKLVFQSIGIIVVSSLFIIGLGILVTIIFSPARIPILIEGQKESISLDIGKTILELFPSNMFTALAGGGILETSTAGNSSGVYLLPIWLFATFFGAAFSYDRVHSKSIISLVDSLSRIFYYLLTFFSEILGIVFIFLGAFWAVRFHKVLNAAVFKELMILLGIYGIILCFVILPLFLYMFKPKVNPWKQLYGALGPAIAGFFSGDIHFTLPLLIRHAKENHGVQRRANAIALALFSSFGRAGSSAVAAMSLIVIIKSYSSLGLSAVDLITILLFAWLVSFLLPRHSINGAYVALAVLCSWYEKGFEAGYLILKPIAFYLGSIATLIDVVVMSLSTYVIGKLNGYQEEQETRHFI
jgi:Na+/H+-dicarboxylate symporter